MERCSSAGYLTEFALACYMLIANVVLINLLIAMMSFSFESIQENRMGFCNEWYMWKYHLIKEYYKRPVYVPPFNFIYFIIRALKSTPSSVKSWETITGHKDQLSQEDAMIIDKFGLFQVKRFLSDLKSKNYARVRI